MSVDYDPVKAHEYYMRHRKLKGRHPTKGMSTIQKEQWSYAKNQLQEAKRKQLANITEQKKEQIKNLNELKRTWKERLTEQTKQKIEELRERLKGMPAEKRKLFREGIQGMIGHIREDLKTRKSVIDTKDKSDKIMVKERATAGREKAKEEYNKGLDEAYRKIRG